MVFLRRLPGRIIRNDTGRHALASLLALLLAVSAVVVAKLYGAALWSGDSPELAGTATPLLGTYLVFWICYGGLYCGITHLYMRRIDSERFLRLSAEQGRRKRRIWERWLGNESAESLTMTGALLSAAFVLGLAHSGQLRDGAVNLFLGFGGVAASWALMAYSFAGTYARKHAVGEKLAFPFPDPPVFGDFLSHSIFISTFLGSQAKASSPEVFTAMRTHSMLAFVFNAVIVAMTVSVLFGTLVS